MAAPRKRAAKKAGKPVGVRKGRQQDLPARLRAELAARPQRLNPKQQANQDRLERDLNKLRGGSFPTYVPYKRKGQKGRRYRNVETGEIVTDYYYSKVLNAELRKDDITYSAQTYRSYQTHLRRQREIQRSRDSNVIESFSLRQDVLGAPMTDEEIIEDDRFQDLVDELRYWSRWERIFSTPENLARYTGIGTDDIIDRLLIERTGKTPEELREEVYNAIISNPEYQRVLVQLGRRDPTETREIGSYPTGHMKLVVVPHYQSMLQGS